MRGARRASALATLLAVCAACGGTGAEGPVIEFPVANDPTIAFKAWIRVGSQDDPPGKEGLAFLTGQLLAQGSTTKHRYDKILEKLYPLAASYAMRVDREMSVLSGRTHRDNVDEFFELFTDAYLRPAFLQEDFERVKADTINYIEKVLRYASDEELAKAALYHFIFEGTRYRHPSEGLVASLKSITLEDVRRFYQQRYTRDAVVLALGGGYDPGLVDRFVATLEMLPAGSPAPPPPPEPAPFAGRHVVLVSKPGADASLSFGFPIRARRGEKDFYALWIANSYFGEHRNSASHLYQVIREARGLNYGDYSYIEAFPEGGQRRVPPTHVARRQQIFEVWIRTLPNEQAVFALRAALRELQQLVDRGLTEEQFELTRTFLRKYVLHLAETTSERLGYAVDDRFYGIGQPGHLARSREMLDTLSLEDVNAAIRRHLQYDDIKIAIVTGQAERLREQLTSDAPTPIQYTSARPQQVLEEDRAIATYPLRIAAENVRIVPVEAIFER